MSSPSSSFTDIQTFDGDKRMTFTINDVHVAVVNAVRRCIISHVPTVAFDYNPMSSAQQLPQTGILIRSNASPLHNEMLGHRISIVPICVDERQLKQYMQDSSLFKFAIKTKNMTSGIRLVTTKDISVYDKHGAPVPPEVRDRLFPANDFTGDHILLTKLNPGIYDGGNGGELDIECVASVGTESKHSRWCPVSVCYFVNKVDRRAADEAFSKKGLPETHRPQFDALEALRHYHKNKYGEANAFEFRLESECGLRAPFLVYQGFKIVKERVATIRRAIESRDTSKVAIASTAEIAEAKNDPTLKSKSTTHSQRAEDATGMYNIIVSHEDHTCGNLVQALIYDKNFRQTDPSNAEITYIGYHQPHPLEHCIVFRVALKRPSLANVEAFMVTNLAWVERVLEGYTKEWISASGIDDVKKGYGEDLL